MILGKTDKKATMAATISAKIVADIPKHHTRQMRREFRQKFDMVAKVKPAIMREMYCQLTHDASSAACQTTAEVDEQVRQPIDLQDPDIVYDLREHLPGRPTKYEDFWNATEAYLQEIVQTTVQERRHDAVMYTASAISAPSLLRAVATRNPDCAVPSAQWLRLQFWLKDPTRKTALQHTGRLKVKYIVQQRQLGKEHPDQRYASADFRYQKKLAVRFRQNTTLVSMDDKHKVKVGEPGCPLAAVEGGRQVLVGLDTVFQVAGHDFSRFTLTPSVTFAIDMPNSIDDSFYEGQVHVGLEDSVFEASSPLRHATEQGKILDGKEKTEILTIYSDGGPDHRLNFLSVQLSFISLFLKHDLDALIVVRTPPDHSWKNPA